MSYRISEAEGNALIVRMGGRATIGPRVGDKLAEIAAKLAKPQEGKRAKYGNRIEGRYRSKREAAYARLLADRASAGEIAAWYYEPVSLVVQENGGKVCRWKPDFMVQHLDGSIEYIEVKGMVQRYVTKDVLDARSRYPFWKFTVVAYKSGKWEEIL